MADPIINKPKELRNFAHKLEHFNKTVNEKTNQMQSLLRNLGDSWRDSQYELLSSKISSILTFVSFFNEESDSAIKNLLIDAEILEKFLDTK